MSEPAGEPGGSGAARAPGTEREAPALRLAEPPSAEPAAAHAAEWAAAPAGEVGEADAAAAALAREVAESAAAAEDDLRRRAEAAARELGLRREAAEAEQQEDRGAPGLGAIGLELAVGALRLARAIAVAPIRIGLAFLRPREV